MVFITHDLAEALKLGDRILIMRDGEIVQIGTPARGGRRAGRRLRPRLRQRRTPVARAHAEVGDARRRRPARRDPGDGPVLQADQIVRDAARVVLDHHGPCRWSTATARRRVDDEDILRSWSRRRTARDRDRAAPDRPAPSAKEQQPYVDAAQEAAHRRQAARRSSVVWIVGCGAFKGQSTLALGLQDTDRRCTSWLNDVRDWVQLRRPGQLVLRRRPRRHRRRSSTGSSCSSRADQHPRLRRGRCPRSAGSAWWRSRPGSPAPSPACGRRSWSRSSMLSFGVFGLWQDSMDTLIITVIAVVALHRDRPAARHLDGPAQGGLGRSSRRCWT